MEDLPKYLVPTLFVLSLVVPITIHVFAYRARWRNDVRAMVADPTGEATRACELALSILRRSDPRADDCRVQMSAPGKIQSTRSANRVDDVATVKWLDPP